MANLNADDPRVRVAVFGAQVEQFLESDIGQYLIGQAEEEYEQAMQELAVVAPWRRRRIQQLQNQAKVAGSIQQWLAMAIENGHQATQLLEDE